MKFPGFTAESSLGKPTRTYRGQYLYSGLAQSQTGFPANIVPSQIEEMDGEGMEEMEVEGIEAEDADIEVEDVEIEENGEED